MLSDKLVNLKPILRFEDFLSFPLLHGYTQLANLYFNWCIIAAAQLPLMIPTVGPSDGPVAVVEAVCAIWRAAFKVRADCGFTNSHGLAAVLLRMLVSVWRAWWRAGCIHRI